MKEYTKDNLPEIGEKVQVFCSAKKDWISAILRKIEITKTGVYFIVGLGSYSKCRPIPQCVPKFGDWVECPDGRVGLFTTLDDEGDGQVEFDENGGDWHYFELSQLKPSTREAWEKQNKES